MSGERTGTLILLPAAASSRRGVSLMTYTANGAALHVCCYAPCPAFLAAKMQWDLTKPEKEHILLPWLYV